MKALKTLHIHGGKMSKNEQNKLIIFALYLRRQKTQHFQVYNNNIRLLFFSLNILTHPLHFDKKNK